MFQKILLPTDGSRHSEAAARVAAEVARRHSATVHPIVAVEYQYVTDEELPAELARALRERVRARADRALRQASETVRQTGGRGAEGKVLEGPPADVILREAEDGEYDLIVMGSRGVSLEQGHHRLVGSITERVLHRTPCPVLVIRAEDQP